MMLDTQQELFEHELRDVYDAEKKLDRALETMAKKVSDAALSDSFREHRRVTQAQAKRLEQIFKLLDKKPRREPCRGINGLINEFTEFTKKEEPSDEILNGFATGAALKIEQYEIVAYQSLIRLGTQLGLSEAVDLLTSNLTEEQETAQTLELMADELAGPLPVLSQRPDEPVVVMEAMEDEVILPETEEVTPSQPSL
jgi:ferritin-like metal-binding protein YciE